MQNPVKMKGHCLKGFIVNLVSATLHSIQSLPFEGFDPIRPNQFGARLSRPRRWPEAGAGSGGWLEVINDSSFGPQVREHFRG